MKIKEAADRLTALLNEIDNDGITVVTEDCGTVYLVRSRTDEFSEINDHRDSGKWATQ